MNTGQVCTAATRIIIPASMKEKFEEAVKKVLPSFPVGDPLDKDNVTGPLVAEKQWDRVQDYIKKEWMKVQSFLLAERANRTA